MAKSVLSLIALAAIISCDCATHSAAADGAPVVRHARKVHHRVVPTCVYDRCGLPVGCPDGTCYSLYGAYGPYGGPLYWSRYTPGGWWGYRWR